MLWIQRITEDGFNFGKLVLLAQNRLRTGNIYYRYFTDETWNRLTISKPLSAGDTIEGKFVEIPIPPITLNSDFNYYENRTNTAIVTILDGENEAEVIADVIRGSELFRTGIANEKIEQLGWGTRSIPVNSPLPAFTPHWQVKYADSDPWGLRSYLIRERDNFQCQRCGVIHYEYPRLYNLSGSKLSTVYHDYTRLDLTISIDNNLNFNLEFDDRLKNPVLQVHHKYYLAGRANYDYPDEALITVCQSCHQHIHGLI
jgi:hypothetical protein